MDKLVVTRPVVVKVRVTDGFKKAYAAQTEYSVRRLDAELKGLEAQEKRFDEASPTDSGRLEQLRLERKKRSDERERLLQQAQKVLGLASGTEMVHGRVESLVEVGVGDEWRQVMGVEIVIEDGIVAQIRYSRPGENNGV